MDGRAQSGRPCAQPRTPLWAQTYAFDFVRLHPGTRRLRIAGIHLRPPPQSACRSPTVDGASAPVGALRSRRHDRPSRCSDARPSRSTSFADLARVVRNALRPRGWPEPWLMAATMSSCGTTTARTCTPCTPTCATARSTASLATRSAPAHRSVRWATPATRPHPTSTSAHKHPQPHHGRAHPVRFGASNGVSTRSGCPSDGVPASRRHPPHRRSPPSNEPPAGRVTRSATRIPLCPARSRVGGDRTDLAAHPGDTPPRPRA